MLIVGIAIILISIAIGVLMYWGGAMSDDPELGQKLAGQAAWVFAIGIAIGLVICTIGHW